MANAILEKQNGISSEASIYTVDPKENSIFQDIAEGKVATIIDMDGTSIVGFNVIDDQGLEANRIIEDQLYIDIDGKRENVTSKILFDETLRDEDGFLHVYGEEVSNGFTVYPPFTITPANYKHGCNPANVYMPPVLVEQMKALIDAGHPEYVSICTGRFIGDLRDVLNQSGFEERYINQITRVTSHGGIIQHSASEGRTVCQESIAPVLTNEDRHFLNAKWDDGIYKPDSVFFNKLKDAAANAITELYKTHRNETVLSEAEKDEIDGFSSKLFPKRKDLGLELGYVTMVQDVAKALKISATDEVEPAITAALAKVFQVEIDKHEEQYKDTEGRTKLIVKPESNQLEILQEGINKGEGVIAVLDCLQNNSKLGEGKIEKAVFIGDSYTQPAKNGEGFHITNDYPGALAMAAESGSIELANPFFQQQITTTKTAADFGLEGECWHVLRPEGIKAIPKDGAKITPSKGLILLENSPIQPAIIFSSPLQMTECLADALKDLAQKINQEQEKGAPAKTEIKSLSTRLDGKTSDNVMQGKDSWGLSG